MWSRFVVKDVFLKRGIRHKSRQGHVERRGGGRGDAPAEILRQFDAEIALMRQQAMQTQVQLQAEQKWKNQRRIKAEKVVKVVPNTKDVALPEVDFSTLDPSYSSSSPSWKSQIISKRSKLEYDAKYADAVKSLINKDVEAKDIKRRLRRHLAPFHDVPYSRQVAFKKQKHDEFVFDLLNQSHSRQDHVRVFDVRRTERVLEYRNTDEFGVFNDEDGGGKAVGFFLGSTLKGNAVCVDAEDVDTVKAEHKDVAKAFQRYIREESKWPQFLADDDRDCGFWRGIIVRSNSAAQTMATVAVSKLYADANVDIDEEKRKLADFFHTETSLNTLYLLQTNNVRINDEDEPEHVFGPKSLTETIREKNFLIDATSPFPLNALCVAQTTAVLHRELNLYGDETLIDVNCGGGFYDLAMAERAKRVIGLGVSERAIRLAEETAQVNGIRNVRFLAKSADKVLETLLQRLGEKERVVILADVGHYALGATLTRLLRKVQDGRLKRLVYMTTMPEAQRAQDDFKNLMGAGKQKKKYMKVISESAPFELKRAYPIDFFPQTKLCQHVLTFKRR